MAKPIYLSEEILTKVVEEFRQSVANANLFGGEIDFRKKFNYSRNEDEKVRLIFRPAAYIKMLELLRHYNSEVAWHGTVEREGDDTFIITDVIVYPQTVAAATVNTDQDEYQQWLLTLDDEYFNAMRMQGHSHVNMGTSPSPTDDEHQRAILSQLKDDDYYIFMVYNKSLSHTIRIYDYANNVMYEDADIALSVADEGFDAASFIEEADRLVKRKAPTVAPYSGYSGAYGSHGGSYYGGYGRDKDFDKPSKSDKKEPAKREPANGKAEAKPTVETKAPVKGKRGCPPKAYAAAKGAEKLRPANAQISMSSRPGFYGANDTTTDWDEEIFGDHRFDT